MYSRMSRQLLDQHYVRYCFHFNSGTASASNTDSLNHFRGYGFGTILQMQPSFGFGFAASKTQKTMQARVHSVMNHIVGVGLYLFALMIN